MFSYPVLRQLIAVVSACLLNLSFITSLFFVCYLLERHSSDVDHTVDLMSQGEYEFHDSKIQ